MSGQGLGNVKARVTKTKLKINTASAMVLKISSMQRMFFIKFSIDSSHIDSIGHNA